MSKEYNAYIREHRANVRRGFDWMLEHFRNTLEVIGIGDIEYLIDHHDYSKESEDEYAAYDNYFYGGNRSFDVVRDFNFAWLHHIHNNPHHWQHWVLTNDDPENGSVGLDMSAKYIIEMICDWWSFSWKTGNLFEIFNWYEKHKDYMILSEETRTFVETFLARMKIILEGGK